MTTDASTLHGSPHPFGLGGPLWLLGVPLLLCSTAAATLTLSIPWTPGTASGSGLDDSEYTAMIVNELAILLIWLASIVVAEAFFRRSPRFPAIASLWLIALCLLRWFTDHTWSPLSGPVSTADRLQRHVGMWGLVLGALVYLRVSTRVRNTFRAQPPPPRRQGLRCFLSDGPYDWGGGVWCLVGTLGWLLMTHIGLMIEYAPAILPPDAPYPAEKMAWLKDNADGNSAAALILIPYAQELGFVPVARLIVSQYAAGVALALWSAGLFVRRSGRLRWTSTACALLLLSSGLTAKALRDRGSYPGMCLDCSGPDDIIPFAAASLILVAILLTLPAVRRRFA